MLQKTIPNFIRNRSIGRLIIILNVVLFFNITYKFSDDIYTHKHEIQARLKSDHLMYLGVLLLEYYRSCQQLPDDIKEINDLKKCINLPMTNSNLTDVFNKAVFYKKEDSKKAFIAYHENSTFIKTNFRLIKSAFIVDANLMTIQSIDLPSPYALECCGEPPAGSVDGYME